MAPAPTLTITSRLARDLLPLHLPQRRIRTYTVKWKTHLHFHCQLQTIKDLHLTWRINVDGSSGSLWCWREYMFQCRKACGSPQTVSTFRRHKQIPL